MDENTERSASEQLTRVVRWMGGFRTEWLEDDAYRVFTAPFFFPELETSRPCILEGGRGTGKTTLLRSLSYQGQFALHHEKFTAPDSTSYVGVYWKLLTASVRVFEGPELDKAHWHRLFAHYWNLSVGWLLLEYWLWWEGVTGLQAPPPAEMRLDLEATLGRDLPADVAGMMSTLRRELLKLGRFAANAGSRGESPELSAFGEVPSVIAAQMRRTPVLGERPLFILLDEYEALTDEQQVAVNTLVKQSDGSTSYKIAVRELGLRQHSTLNPREILRSPADYALFNIPERLGERFEEYAVGIVEKRLAEASAGSFLKPKELFPGYTLAEEAEALGVAQRAKEVRSKLATKSARLEAEGLPDIQLAFADYWCAVRGEPLDPAIHELAATPDAWKDRLENYLYAFLFTLRLKKRGIRKFYAGWSTLSGLSGNNIRYLLELVSGSIEKHLHQGRDLNTPIEQKIQTGAAQSVGRKTLKELEGVSGFGPELTRLLFGLGRLFGRLAEQAVGRAPETNQFDVDFELATESRARSLLDTAVEHTALLRLTGSKLLTERDTRTWDYMIHPVFAPFFVFSYRKKRKLRLTSAELVALSESTGPALHEMLTRRDVAPSEDLDTDLPEQLALFRDLYAGP